MRIKEQETHLILHEHDDDDNDNDDELFPLHGKNFCSLYSLLNMAGWSGVHFITKPDVSIL